MFARVHLHWYHLKQETQIELIGHVTCMHMFGGPTCPSGAVMTQKRCRLHNPLACISTPETAVAHASDPELRPSGS